MYVEKNTYPFLRTLFGLESISNGSFIMRFFCFSLGPTKLFFVWLLPFSLVLLTFYSTGFLTGVKKVLRGVNRHFKKEVMYTLTKRVSYHNTIS